MIGGPFIGEKVSRRERGVMMEVGWIGEDEFEELGCFVGFDGAMQIGGEVGGGEVNT